MSTKAGKQDIRNIDDVEVGIKKHWPTSTAGTTALQIIYAIRSSNTRPQVWRIGDMLEVLGKTVITPDFVSALSILTQSDYAIFTSAGAFVDEQGKHHRLTSDEFQQVQNDGTLLHPITGEAVTRATERVIPYFELNAELFPEAYKAPGEKTPR